MGKLSMRIHKKRRDGGDAQPEPQNLVVSGSKEDRALSYRGVGRMATQQGTCVECRQELTINKYANGSISIPLLCQACLEARVRRIKQLRALFPPQKRGRKRRNVA